MRHLFTPEKESRYEQTIRKSRFIACVNHATDRQSAVALAEAARTEFPDARHVCWAFVCGGAKHPGACGFFDDGEPTGTAGKPILNVLQRNPLGDTCILVVRYFGGIKLGAGGLVRAYSSSASQALLRTTLIEMVDKTVLTVRLPFALEDCVRRRVNEYGGSLIDEEYSDSVALTLEIPQSAVERFIHLCAEIGKGEIMLRDRKDSR